MGQRERAPNRSCAVTQPRPPTEAGGAHSLPHRFPHLLYCLWSLRRKTDSHTRPGLSWQCVSGRGLRAPASSQKNCHPHWRAGGWLSGAGGQPACAASVGASSEAAFGLCKGCVRPRCARLRDTNLRRRRWSEWTGGWDAPTARTRAGQRSVCRLSRRRRGLGCGIRVNPPGDDARTCHRRPFPRTGPWPSFSRPRAHMRRSASFIVGSFLLAAFVPVGWSMSVQAGDSARTARQFRTRRDAFQTPS